MTKKISINARQNFYKGLDQVREKEVEQMKKVLVYIPHIYIVCSKYGGIILPTLLSRYAQKKIVENIAYAKQIKTFEENKEYSFFGLEDPFRAEEVLEATYMAGLIGKHINVKTKCRYYEWNLK